MDRITDWFMVGIGLWVMYEVISMIVEWNGINLMQAVSGF